MAVRDAATAREYKEYDEKNYPWMQWRSDDDCQPGLPGWSAEEKVRLGEELADVLSYVMRLSDVAEIDLPAAFLDKMAKKKV